MKNILLLQLSGLAVLSCDDPILEAEREIPKTEIRDEGIDALGLYISNNLPNSPNCSPYIIIDKIKCAKAAADLAVNPANIETIVRIHELSHYVTHLGKAIVCGNIWGAFPNAAHADRERVAQGLTYLWILKFGDDDLLTAFEKLSAKCPPPYQKWRYDLLSLNPHYKNQPENFAKAWAVMAKDLYDSSDRIDFELLCKFLNAGLSIDDVAIATNL